MKKSKKLLWLLLIPALAAIGIFCYYTAYRPALIWNNEWAVSDAMKCLAPAEADFRANDLDWNHVNDFWTGDVAGLWYVKSNAKGNEKEVRLIDRAIAEADVRALKPLVPNPVPYHGYFFIALDEDDTLRGVPERLYKQDTEGSPKMGKVHNTSKFGFCAYPAEYGVTGRYTYIVNENNTVFRWDNGGKAVTHFPNDSKPPTGCWQRID